MRMVSTFLMLLRRELWEHRGVVLAPAVIAALTTLILLTALVRGHAFADHTAGMGLVQGLSLMAPLQREAVLGTLLAGVTPLFFLTMLVLIVFYAADSLYAERRDRSILFWKSLPVTDLATVLSKLCTALLTIPLVTLLLIALTQLITLLVATLLVWAAGGDAWPLVWRPAPLLSLWGLQLYGTLAVMFWYAPLIGWLLLASAWARKAPMLWAVLPIVVVGQLEVLALGTARVYSLVAERFIGVYMVAFTSDFTGIVAIGEGEATIDAVQALPGERILGFIDVAGLLAAPGFWGGLVAAALFIAAAVLLRRFRDEG